MQVMNLATSQRASFPGCTETATVLPRSATRRVAVSARAHAAFQRPLQGRPLHDLERQSIVPFLAPSDGVPFACFLTLHRTSTFSPEKQPVPLAPSDVGVLELVYVLDGIGQLQQATSQDSFQLQPGDSLAISSKTTTFEAIASEGCRPDDWHLATLHLLFDAGLPDAIDGRSNAVQKALDSRLSAASVRRVSSAISIAISQRIAVAPQPAAARPSGLPNADDGISSGSSSGSEDRSIGSTTGRGWLQGRRRFQWQLMLPMLRASKAIRRILFEALSWQRWRQEGVMQRKLRELDAVQLPNQTNRLALAFSPLQSPPSSFCCGLEVFEPSHMTAPHVHNGAWELFFIISGTGSGFCEQERFHIKPGDVVAFPPGCVHGIDNADDAPMFTIEVMLPAGGRDVLEFAAFAQAGVATRFSDDELSALFAPGCSS